MKKIAILAFIAFSGFTSWTQSCNLSRQITTADSVMCAGDTVSLSFLLPATPTADTVLPTPIVNNNGQDGNMFNITATNTIRIKYFEGLIANIPNTTTDYSIYYKQGTHVGFETNPAAWTLIADSIYFNPNAPNALSTIPYNVNIVIPAGETYAFYLTNTSAAVNNNRYHTGTATGTVLSANPDFTVYEGTGGAYPFGTFFNARLWEGIIHYDSPEINYLWNTGDTTPAITVVPASTMDYSCEMTIVGMPCVVTDTITVEVNPVPVLNFPDITNICVGDTASLDAGNPTSTYSWSTAETTQTIYSSINGEIAVTVTDTNGCVSIDSTVVTVNALPVVTFSPVTVCIDDAITLNQGSPAGGIYSGTGVSGSDFDPSITGTGTYPLIYEFTDTLGCASSDTASVLVNPLPIVTFSAMDDLCATGEVISLDQGLPFGGSYSGPGAAGVYFDLSVAGPGTHELIYEYTDTNGCVSSDTASVLINPLPVVAFSAIGDLCVYNSAIVLNQGSPAGGSYSGTGVTGTNFDPAVAGTGIYELTYEFTDASGCENTDTSMVFVDECLSIEEHSTTLMNIYPNPFKSSTSISLDTSIELHQTLFEVYDMTGKKVLTLTPVDYTFEFSRGNLQSGMYHYGLISNGKSLKTGELILE